MSIIDISQDRPAILFADGARAWIARGFAVLPARERTTEQGKEKAPYTANGFLDATTDGARVAEWAKKWPTALVGVHPDPDSFVLDLDGESGSDWLHGYEKKHGELPTTLRTITPGGVHYWFRTNGGMAHQTAGKIAPGVDIRTEKGYAIGAGARETGRYEVDTDLPLAVAPDELLALVTSKSAAPSAEAHIWDMIAATAVYKPPTGLPASQTVRLIEILIESFGAHSLERDSEGGFRLTRPGKAPGEGPGVSVGRIGAGVCRVFTGNWPGLPEGRYDVSQLLALLAPQRPGPAFIDFAKGWDDIADPAWLVDGIFLAGASHALVAPAKTGKSLFTLAVAASLATGRVFGAAVADEVNERRHVLICDYENRESSVRRRLVQLGYGEEEQLGDYLHYRCQRGGLQLDTEQGGKALRELAESCGAELVIIGGFQRAHLGDENDSKPVREVHHYSIGPLLEDGRAVAREDNTGRDPSKLGRGSSAKNDDVDVVYSLKRTGNEVQLTAALSREDCVPDKQSFELVEDGWTSSYLRRNSGGWPPGTAAAATVLEKIGAPLSGRGAEKAVRDAIAAGIISGDDLGREAVRAAARYRAMGLHRGLL